MQFIAKPSWTGGLARRRRFRLFCRHSRLKRGFSTAAEKSFCGGLRVRCADGRVPPEPTRSGAARNSRQEWTSRNCFGVMFMRFLNVVTKWGALLKPEASAMSATVNFVWASSFFAWCSR